MADETKENVIKRQELYEQVMECRCRTGKNMQKI